MLEYWQRGDGRALQGHPVARLDWSCRRVEAYHRGRHGCSIWRRPDSSVSPVFRPDDLLDLQEAFGVHVLAVVETTSCRWLLRSGPPKNVEHRSVGRIANVSLFVFVSEQLQEKA